MARKIRPQRTPVRTNIETNPLNRRVAIGISAGLVALVALAYAPVSQFGFVPLDDPLYVTNNPHVVSGLTGSNIWWAFTSRWASYWIPLTWISYMSEVQIFGVRPEIMHITQCRAACPQQRAPFQMAAAHHGSRCPSAFAAALFAVHPLHVESVAWITERKDVLSTCFLLLALDVYTAWTQRPTPLRYAGLCALAIAGLMAKPMLVTLPFVLLLCDVWPLQRIAIASFSLADRARWLALVREKWALFGIVAVAGAAAFLTQRRGGAMVASEVFPLGLRVENAIVSAVIYVWQAIWPADLIVWYAYPDAIPIWQVAGALVLLVGASAIAIRAAKSPYVAAGLVLVSRHAGAGERPRAGWPAATSRPVHLRALHGAVVHRRLGRA